jgi:hypothetical protein
MLRFAIPLRMPCTEVSYHLVREKNLPQCRALLAEFQEAFQSMVFSTVLLR